MPAGGGRAAQFRVCEDPRIDRHLGRETLLLAGLLRRRDCRVVHDGETEHQKNGDSSEV